MVLHHVHNASRLTADGTFTVRSCFHPILSHLCPPPPPPVCGSCATPTRRPGTPPRPRLPHCNHRRALTHISSSPTPCVPWPLPPHAPHHSSTHAHVTPTRPHQLPSNLQPPTHRVIPLIINRGMLSGCHLPIHYASKVGSLSPDALPPTSLFLGHTCPSLPLLRTAFRCPRRTTGSRPCGRTRRRRPWCWPRRCTTSSRARYPLCPTPRTLRHSSLPACLHNTHHHNAVAHCDRCVSAGEQPAGHQELAVLVNQLLVPPPAALHHRGQVLHHLALI